MHYKTWKGFRLCAIDGTSIQLPNETDITEHFGVQKGRGDQADCTMGMASVFYDVLNHIVIDSTIKPRSGSEHQCAAEHLKHADKNDLILYDRGYNAFWLYALHTKHNRAFCMRAKANKNLLVKDFIKSNKRETVVKFNANKPSIKTCVEVLITNLMDTSKYEDSIFKSLYHQRWGIEENYKCLKQWVEIENSSGKSALSVQQDFYAKIMAMNLTALMAMEAKKTIAKTTRKLKLKYQINFAQALSKMKHVIVRLILHARSNIELLIKQTISYLSKTFEGVRAGRSAPRKLKNIKNDIRFPAYKSAL